MKKQTKDALKLAAILGPDWEEQINKPKSWAADPDWAKRPVVLSKTRKVDKEKENEA